MQQIVGDPLQDLEIMIYADADVAGDQSDRKSTIGIVVRIEGPNTQATVSTISKKQGCASSRTTGAEIVAAHIAVKDEGIPATLLEDNGATALILERG